MQSIQTAIESLQAKGICPRLHVNVTHEDAVCPDFVRDKWTERLVIDLDPSYPLELEFTAVGVEANLSFGGFVTRCTFPWPAIYVVAERGSDRGRVFEQNVPASLRPTLAPNAVDPELTKASDKDRERSGRRKRRRPSKAPAVVGLQVAKDSSEETEAEADPETGEIQAGPQAEASSETPAEPEPETKTDQQAVKTRRATFTVIDGGA